MNFIYYKKIKFQPFYSNYKPNTVTDVVPSPTSSSCTLDISTKILAAGLSTPTDFNMVAPSFVTSTCKYIKKIPTLQHGRHFQFFIS
jgi:hypothetical protein